MAQAELEEKFKGIGLAEATAKCESDHLVLSTRIPLSARRLQIHHMF